MRTISKLNSKAWYRLLKVIYVLTFIPIFILALFAGYMSTEPKFDNEKSYIKCDDGRELGLEENDIYLYSSYISILNDKKIKKLCFPVTGQYRNKITGEIISAEEFLRKYGAEQIPVNYELISVYTERNWFKAIGTSFLSIVVAIFLFELIKRIFYYIVLGSFRPQK